MGEPDLVQRWGQLERRAKTLIRLQSTALEAQYLQEWRSISWKIMNQNIRLQEIMTLIEELVNQIPMAEKLLEIKGVGIKTVSGFLQR